MRNPLDWIRWRVYRRCMIGAAIRASDDLQTSEQRERWQRFHEDFRVKALKYWKRWARPVIVGDWRICPCCGKTFDANKQNHVETL